MKSPLVESAELAAELVSPNLVVADVRWYLGKPGEGRRRYDEAHIPGAIFVDVDTQLAAHDGPGRHPLPSVAEFAARMGALGIGDADEVVAYDDVGGTIAARLWWMLDVLGHRARVVGDRDLPAVVAAGVLGVLIGLHVDEVDDAPDLVLGADRDLDRDHVRPERALERLERAEEVGQLFARIALVERRHLGETHVR